MCFYIAISKSFPRLVFVPVLKENQIRMHSDEFSHHFKSIEGADDGLVSLQVNFEQKLHAQILKEFNSD